MKKLPFILMCVISIFVFSGCSDNTSSDNISTNTDGLNATVTAGSGSSSENFIIEKEICNNAFITLAIKEITFEGVEFEVTNNYSETILPHISFSLDGTQVRGWSDGAEWEIPPGNKKTCLYHCDLETLEHKLLSMNVLIFVNNIGIEEFDISNFDLGGNANPEEIQPGKELYKNEKLTVEFLNADADGLNFRVINNRDEAIGVRFDELYINGGSEIVSVTVTSVVPHAQAIYSIDLRSADENYFPDDLVSFDGIITTDVQGRALDRFPVSLSLTPNNE